MKAHINTKQLMKRTLLSFLLICGLATIPQTTLNTCAQDSLIQPRADVTEWKYKIENNKLYKRLYNSTQECWVGDWIYVCDI